jgi:transposase
MSVVTLVSLERRELEHLARSRTRALERAKKRAKVILMLSAGGSYNEISKRLGCTIDYISYWRGRFRDKRLIGLVSRDDVGGRRRNSEQIEARILEWTKREPTDGSTQWSSRRLAKEVGASRQADRCLQMPPTFFGSISQDRLPQLFRSRRECLFHEAFSSAYCPRRLLQLIDGLTHKHHRPVKVM